MENVRAQEIKECIYSNREKNKKKPEIINELRHWYKRNTKEQLSDTQSRWRK